MSENTLYLASDHRGFSLKNILAEKLREKGFDLCDLGPQTDARCDASDYAVLVAEALQKKEAARGILICGTGQMMAITANRYRHLRAALCLTPAMVRLAREHNDANILVLAADLIDHEQALQCVSVFLDTSFLGGRYAERLQKLSDLGGI